MPRTELTRAALLLLLWLASAAVQAHGLDVIAQHSEGQVSGLALYSDGTPAAAIYVALVASEDASRVLAQSKTGEDGRFTFAAREDGGMRVIAEGEEGHRAQALVSEVPSSSGSNQSLLLLREDIARLEQHLWWRDVLGGIGYLVGVLGLWALWRSRQSGRGL
ncbi:carboxypeptidase regulatory-like domain-containing protein [Pseudomonas abyssi]|uniref:Nickel transport protein n=1 Tax=Pseudomonas abyssi TaxID=170540 RepID=A0A395R302_9PSED|nr:carboxypeptidase regulatory-like domain-containing protein [Halopseudomonas gallaeciensis]RGP54172.1 hypothetical protein ASB58_14505 [Halopseudomonas gallaeciensis]